MAGPHTELPGLEYLRDESVFQMEKVNEYDSPPPSKIFKIVSTNSVSYCCTVPNSNDLVIRDEKHGNNRFCINGATLALTTVYSSVNQPIGWVHKGTEAIRATDERPKNCWNWKLNIHHTRIHPERKNVSNIAWIEKKEWRDKKCGSITVEMSRITWDLDVNLPPALKALILAQGINWAVLYPEFKMKADQSSPCGIDSLLWVDYTEQLTAEEEAVPVETLEFNGKEFTIRPYINGSEENSYHGFTLSDQGNNVLLMLKVTKHRQGDLRGTLTGFDLNHYGFLKTTGMDRGELFLNIRYGPLGLEIGGVKPAFTDDVKGWHLIDYLENDSSPNKNLYTDGKFEDWAYRFTNSRGELVCTYRIRKGYHLKIELEKDFSTETKLILVSYAVKIACMLAKLHTQEYIPVVRNVYPLRHPMHLVRTSTGRKADFQSVFTQFSAMQSVFIRGAFKIADEDVIFLHLIDPQSKEVIYTVRCEVGAAENYLLPFQAEIMDDEGNLVLFAHQPAIVPTMMINQKEGNNIGVYEHGQREGSECPSSLQTDGDDSFGTMRRLVKPQLGIYVVNRHNKNIAGMYSPQYNVTELNIYEKLTCDKVMVIVAAAIREAFYTFKIHQNLLKFPTLAS